MKIAVLNECFLSQDNLSYLKSAGDLEIYDDTTSEDKAIARMAGKDIVLSDMFECPLNAKVLKAAIGLKLLCINSTGFAFVDMAAATFSKISIAHTPGFSTEAVAEHAFALLLAVNRRIVEGNSAVKSNPFQINPGDQGHRQFLGSNLFGKTIGIIGLGAIGAHAAKIAQGFGMCVLAYNPSDRKIPHVEQVTLDELYARADIVSLHSPLNEKSKGMINATSIAKMKKGTIFINTASGACVISQDLAAALQEGRIAGAGLDLLDPWNPQNPLLKTPHTVLTPHSAWFTTQALGRIGDTMTDNVKAYIEGKPRNIVPPVPA